MRMWKKIFLFLLTGLLMITAFCLVKNKIQNPDILERDIYTMTDEEYDEYCKAYVEKYHMLPGSRVESWINYEYWNDLRNIPSDIEGLSQYDKAAMGLDEEDGSDTDRDGLTDKEEIEIYDSDPLKTSTAGDLYYDGYKVEHNMDLHTYYEYEGEFEYVGFGYGLDGEVVDLLPYMDTVLLCPTAPESTYAIVTDSSFIIPENTDVYQGFEVRNFTGTISLDFSNLATLQNVDEFDLFVMNDFESELYFCDYEENSGIFYLNYSFEAEYDYYIVVGKSNDALKSSKKALHVQVDFTRNFSGDLYTAYLEDQEEYLITGSPLLTFLDIPIDISYASANEPSKIEIVKNYANEVIDGRPCANLPIQFKQKSFLGLDVKYSILKHLLPSFEYNGMNFKWYHLLYCYVDYNATHLLVEQAKNQEMSIPQQEQIRSFSVAIDELPFSNFASEYSEDGNCVGIAHLTSYLYNNKTFPSSGSYIVDNEVVQWNLTINNENQTLLDEGLSDYKNNQFVQDYKLPNNLSEGEQEFVKMIGCYWAEGNNRISLNDYILKTKKTYDCSLVKKMEKYIDDGKIIDVYLLFDNGMKHAVNIYDYYYDNGSIYFKVYDNNFPLSSIIADKNVFDSFVLRVNINYDSSNLPKSFTYQYMPITSDPMYKATSTQGCWLFFSRRFAMVALDDQWNVLND